MCINKVFEGGGADVSEGLSRGGVANMLEVWHLCLCDYIDKEGMICRKTVLNIF